MTSTAKELAPERLEDVKTLIEMLAFRAHHTPDQALFLWEDAPVSCARVWEQIEQVAAFLMAEGIRPGDRVMLIMPNGEEFFPAFYGVQRAGAIAVPIFPGSGAQRVLSILSTSGARAVIVPTDAGKVVEEYRAAMDQFECRIHALSECLQPVPAGTRFPKLEPEQLAFLQYTSGSTGNSKGVMLTHFNLVSNIRQIVSGCSMTPEDVLVSWIPVYHDLGLIFATMAPFYIGAKVILLPTSLMRMPSWAEAITKYKGTVIAAPDIGYRMLVRQVRDPEKYDLSSLRCALNAAEPVRAQTVEEFERHFGLRHISKPSYGLAEASVGVSYWGAEERPIKIDAKGHVCAGRPLPGVEVVIVRDDGTLADRGEEGELVFRSPSGTQGYFRNPEATEALFWQEGWIRTGDVSYLDADGEIFIVSRKKAMIKHSGRSIAPREVEEVVDDVQGVRLSAAIGVNRGDIIGEQLYVFAELDINPKRAESEGPEIVRNVVASIHKRLGIRPGRVYLTTKRTVPFTYNGKIQHVLLRKSYEDGSLKERGALLYPTY